MKNTIEAFFEIFQKLHHQENYKLAPFKQLVKNESNFCALPWALTEGCHEKPP